MRPKIASRSVEVALGAARAQRELALAVEQLDVCARARRAGARAGTARSAAAAAAAAGASRGAPDARALGIAREHEPAPPRSPPSLAAVQLEHHARRVGLHDLLDPVTDDLAAQDRRGALELSQTQHRAYLWQRGQ